MPSKRIGLFTGLGLFILMVLLPTPQGLSHEAMLAAGVALLMATWWLTEAIPIYVTAFVPLVFFPLLGILSASEVAENYAHNYVLMLLGGFIIAKAIELQMLHKRLALLIIRVMGVNRKRIILSFMLATAFLSMWIANVAVTLMMLPIALAVVNKEEEDEQIGKFGLAMMLAIAYAASIGGMASLIGTPPNLVFAGMVSSLYPDAPDITFTDWMLIGLPTTLIMLPLAWLYLLRFFRVSGSIGKSGQIIEQELNELGKMSSAEKRVLGIFIFTALGWIFRKDIEIGSLTIPGWSSILGISEYVHDMTVAMVSTILLFIIPDGKRVEGGQTNFLMDWKTAESIPWGVTMIVGGGYALAKSFAHTGLANWLGEQITFLHGLPTFLVLLFVVFAITFLTEINSNTATATIFMPILATMAVANEAHPFLFMIPATFACSCAFCMPSGTGVNTVIFASGRVSIPEMAKAGFWMNFITIAVITLIAYFVVVPYFGLNEMPGWVR